MADLNGRKLIVHREPEHGRYVSVKSYSAGESISPLTAPQASVLVDTLFP